MFERVLRHPRDILLYRQTPATSCKACMSTLISVNETRDTVAKPLLAYVESEWNQ
jgi:hypothetical protein